MHYEKRKCPKIHSGSFYLTQEVLEDLNYLAEIESKSRSLVVEDILIFAFKGGKNAEKKKKIYPKTKHNQKNKKNIQKAEYVSKSLFA